MEDFDFFNFNDGNDNSFAELEKILNNNDLNKRNELEKIDQTVIVEFLNNKEVSEEIKVLLLVNVKEQLSLSDIDSNEDLKQIFNYLNDKEYSKSIIEYINLLKDTNKTNFIRKIFATSDINLINKVFEYLNNLDKTIIIDMIINTNFLKNKIENDIFISFVNNYNITFEELAEKAYLSNQNFNRIINFFINDQIERDWENILLYACKLNDVETISLIINKYPDLISYKNNNKTLLMYILENTNKNSDFKSIKKFINNYKDKIDFNAIDTQNKNIFIYAIETQNYELINYIINNIKDIPFIIPEKIDINNINYDNIFIKMLCYLEINKEEIDNYYTLKLNLFKKIFKDKIKEDDDFNSLLDKIDSLLDKIDSKIKYMFTKQISYNKTEKTMLKTGVLLNEVYKNTEYFDKFGKNTFIVEINNKDDNEKRVKLIRNAIQMQIDSIKDGEIRYIDINYISNDIYTADGHSFFIAIDKEQIVVFDSVINYYVQNWSKTVLTAIKDTTFKDKKIKILKTSIQVDGFSCRNYLLEIKQRFSEALQSQNLTEFFSNEENFDKEYSGRSIENMELGGFTDYFNSTFKDNYELVGMLKCLVGIEQRSIGSLEKDLKCAKIDKDKLRENSKLCNNKIVNGIIDMERSKSIDMLLGNATEFITMEKMEEKLKKFKEHNEKLEECCGILQKLDDKIFYLKLQNLDIFIETNIEKEKQFVEKMYFSSKEIEERLSKHQVVVS